MLPNVPQPTIGAQHGADAAKRDGAGRSDVNNRQPCNPAHRQGNTAMTAASPLAPRTAAKLEPGDLVDETEAAAILGCAVQSLRNWRWRGHGGPRARKIGQRLVRYHRADLAAFVDGDKADAA